MKILFVVHQFLPRHRAGTELYTYYLAQELQRRGHAVYVYFTEIHPDRPQYELCRGEFEGLSTFEVVHNHYFRTFRHTYLDRRMDRIFDRILTELRPDVVHVQHLHLHSIGYLDVAKDHGLPVLYTLHEYMLMCIRHGQLLRPGLVPCSGPEPEACARCADIYPTPVAEDSWPFTLKQRHAEDPYLTGVRLREEEIRKRLERVDLFIAPSAFLRDRFIASGMIRREKILFSDNGFPVALFKSRLVERRDSIRLRVGFVGTIAEYKGIHLLLEAFEEIEDPSIVCRIHGNLEAFPDYKERLLSMAGASQVEFMGPFRHSKIVEVLAGIDVLVVPSLWFENSPLTIHEAFLAGVPVIAADQGGMAELVEDGKNGLHFRIGDADDLRRQILRLRREPGLLARLRRQFPPIKSIRQDTDDMERRYQLVCRGESVA